MPSSASARRGKRRFDDDEPAFAKRNRHRRALPTLEQLTESYGLGAADRWSTWDQSTAGERGPRPHPRWLVTELAATDTELGILKTGKEADVFLLRRAVPDTARSCLLAAKRYRSAEHRLFHRDSDYLEGRRVRESRASRAMANRTTVGREMIAGQWANAEFAALCRFYQAGLPVPYPVQILGTELLLEFIGEPDGIAAPRLAETGLRGAQLARHVASARADHDHAGPPGPSPWRSVCLQPAGPPRPADHDRYSPGGRRVRQSARRRVPRTRCRQCRAGGSLPAA